MSEYLNVFDQNCKKVCILENSKNVIEDETINSVNVMYFDLPADDPKSSHCKPFYYVRYGDGQLYRLLQPKSKRNNISLHTYTCEHVIATLVDDVMFGATSFGGRGLYTRDVINFVLSKQSEQRWILGECDFARQFEYSWENENLLTALFSIPNRFTEPYIWRFDTSSYPWVLSLKKIDINENPQFYVRAGKNLLVSQSEPDYSNICTRLYMLGYGEGINQLTVSEVNNGLPYIQSDQSIIDKYGGVPISRILVDRRFEDAQSLLDYGKAQLEALQEPLLSNTVSVADLYNLTHADYDKAEVGRIVLLADDNIKTYITGVRRNHDNVGDMKLTIANKPTDIAGTIADLADRQRIESVYSQGATQLYAQSVQANATKEIGAVIRFYIPEDMRIVNFVKAKITLSSFRSYSKATKGGGGKKYSSSDGGGTTYTSSSGGGSTQTSSSGGGGSTTSGSSSSSTTKSGLIIDQMQTGVSSIGGAYYATTEVNGHSHTYTFAPHDATNGYGAHQHYIYANLSHSHNMEHTHSVSIGAHSHSVSVPDHTHTVKLENHKHTVEIPDHSHDIEQGIFEFGNPTSASIFVNGALKGSMDRDAELDISEYLLDEQKKIPRGSWLTVEIVPNDLAYVTIDLTIKGFCQSRGGSNY